MRSTPKPETSRSFLTNGVTSASLISGEEASSPAFGASTGPKSFSDFQSLIYQEGMSGRKPDLPISIEALEAAAKKVLSVQSYNYAAGGAGAENTMNGISAKPTYPFTPVKG